LQPVHFELAAQLSTRFVNAEEGDFKSRLNNILSVISSKILLLSNDITEGRFVKLRIQVSEDKTDEDKQKEKDHSLIQILNLVDKITVHCEASMKDKNLVGDFDDIAQQCQALLAYPHSWVRLRAAKILGAMLMAVDGEELEMVVKKKLDSDRGFVYYDTEATLKSLVLDLCAQYTPSVSKEMAEQVSSLSESMANGTGEEPKRLLLKLMKV
jgi:U3 small nucleolar RNA-associated protein 20